MMQTSYFHHPDCDFSDPRLVSIARWAPRGYHGRRYSALAPHREMKGMNEADFRDCYKEFILDGLDPQGVANDLGPDAILLCWEKPGEFCHRRLVAEWLEEHLGMKVPEIGEDQRQKPLFK